MKNCDFPMKTGDFPWFRLDPRPPPWPTPWRSQEGPGARRVRRRVPRPGAAEELLQRGGRGGAATGCQSHGEGTARG